MRNTYNRSLPRVTKFRYTVFDAISAEAEEYMTTWALELARKEKQPLAYYEALLLLTNDEAEFHNLDERVQALETVETSFGGMITDILTPHALDDVQNVIERAKMLGQRQF